ncbi:MAG TPA: hypothetical protein VEH30_05035, partial [Terriglobales bacterium]|nr:hypothetical protein [Terriglobales bacterium]
LTGFNVNSYPGGATFSGVGGKVVETINTLNENFGPITYVNGANRSTYNAMILFLRGKAGRRGSFQGSYTLSHAQDFPEADTRFDQDANLNIPQTSSYFNYFGDANWDVRQRFSFSGAYTLPGVGKGVAKVLTSGWEASTIIAVQTGTPFWVIDNRPPDPMCNVNGTPTACSSPAAAGFPVIPDSIAPDSGDYNRDGINYDVPDLPAQNFTGSHSKAAYIRGLFTASDFPQPAFGAEGNEPRNIYRNPGMVQVDASMLKNNHIPWMGEQGNLQFRFDFINLFNHANLGPVDALMGDPGFGKVSTALPGRQLQLGIRVAF